MKQYSCIKSSCEKLGPEIFNEQENDTIYIIDSPASIGKENTSKLLTFSDSFLIPISPSPLDLGALTRFIFKLAANDEDFLKSKPIGLIANRAKIYTRVHQEILKKVEKLNIPLITTLRDTQNYTLPASRGMGFIELPEYNIQKDLASWQPLLKWLDKTRKV